MTGKYAMKPIDPDTAKLAGDCAAQIMNDLAESPEAWRGAAVMAHFVKCVVMAAIDASVGVTGELEIDEAFLCQLLTVGFLENLPYWPQDVTGEPLITDGLPSEHRAHFQGVDSD